jgi:hypothetical protein
MAGKTHFAARTRCHPITPDAHARDVKRAELCSAGRPAPAEHYELPDGLYRQHVPAYDEIVVRKLLVNALVHRPYPLRGDIFLKPILGGLRAPLLDRLADIARIRAIEPGR